MAISNGTDQAETDGLLELPDPETLSEPQLCGRACVWCGGALSNDSAVDLGVQPVDAHGVATHWFPRADKQCVAGRAYAELFVHAPCCTRCVTTAEGCETAVALRRLMREGRQ